MRRRLSLALRMLALLLLVAASAYAIDRWTLQPFRCARAATRGAIALDEAASRADPYLKLRVAKEVTRALSDCECIAPPNVQIAYTRGRAAAMEGNPRQALAEFQRAMEADRRPEIDLALGMAYLDLLDRNAAITHFARAAAFDPARLAEIPFDDVREETRQRLAMQRR